MNRVFERIASWFAGVRAKSIRLEWQDHERRWRKKREWSALMKALLEPALGKIRSYYAPHYTVKAIRPVLPGRRPVIIHALPNVFVGGSTQLVVDLCNQLGHRYDMSVITAAFPKYGRHRGLVTHHHPLPGDRAAIARTIDMLKPDLLHVHYWGDVDTPWYEAVFAAAEQAACPVLQNINTPVTPFSSSAVITNVFVSETIRRAFTSALPGHVIHPGIDVAMFSPRRFGAGAINSIGMVYRLEPDKLNRESILPLIDLVRLRPATRVTVVGGGSLFDSYVAQVRSVGVIDNFEFAGYVPFESLPGWYSRFGTFVAPVWQESFGQVTPFAMAMGLAVAGKHVGALPEILESDETLSESGEALTQKLMEILDDPEQIRMLGKRNREIALRKFRLEDMVAAYNDVYRRVLS